MQEYLDKIQPIEIPSQRRKQALAPCVSAEVKSYQALTSALNLLCRGALP